MKLSEAIRLGAMLGPQCKGSYRLRDATCALGAAAIAMNCQCRDLVTLFPEIGRLGECGLGSKIAELNDFQDYSREQIADWLVESGLDCESVTPAPTEEIAAFAEIVAVN